MITAGPNKEKKYNSIKSHFHLYCTCCTGYFAGKEITEGISLILYRSRGSVYSSYRNYDDYFTGNYKLHLIVNSEIRAYLRHLHCSKRKLNHHAKAKNMKFAYTPRKKIVAQNF
jgi:hypothetical protein